MDNQKLQLNKDQQLLETMTNAQIRLLPKKERSQLLKAMTTARVSQYMSDIFVENLNTPQNHDISN